MLLKLDLHTHCYEATLSNSINSIEAIVEAVKAKGLDGIAVTEHVDKTYGYEVKQIVEEYFNNDVLIIPGQEVNTELVHVQIIELYLSKDVTFRYIAHPYHLTDFCKYVSEHASELHGVEIENYQHKWEMSRVNKQMIQETAKNYNLMLLTNSDAHTLNDIGRYYNEIRLEDLYLQIEQKR